MNKITFIITAVFILFYLQIAIAKDTPEEAFVPVQNPITGEIELLYCPDYPQCPPARKSQELEKTEKDDS